MKKSGILTIAVLLILAAISAAACSGSDSNTGSKAPVGSGAETESAEEKTQSSGSDEKRISWDTLTWHTAEVDTLGNSAVHVTFDFPENFGGYQEKTSTESYISYGSSADYGETEGLYKIIATYYRADDGPTEEQFRNMEGTLSEREINGKQILVNKYYNEEKNQYLYTYFADFGGEEKARVIMIVMDQEEFGGFRAMFERKLWWI